MALMEVSTVHASLTFSILTQNTIQYDFIFLFSGQIAVISLSLTVLVSIVLLWKVFRQERNVRWYHRL